MARNKKVDPVEPPPLPPEALEPEQEIAVNISLAPVEAAPARPNADQILAEAISEAQTGELSFRPALPDEDPLTPMREALYLADRTVRELPEGSVMRQLAQIRFDRIQRLYNNAVYIK